MPERAALALLPVCLLGLVGCGGGSGDRDTGDTASDAIAVTASDSVCTVGRTEVDAGTHRFTVTNQGSKVTEFYVYAAGDRIVGEVENIAPGVARTLLVELPAGTYETACKPGMVGDGIRSRLTVTGAAAELPDEEELRAAVAGYTGYVQDQVAELRQRTAQFTGAVEAGDVARARALYPLARTPYERIEPVAESFGDLDPRIDARENDVEPGTAWTGFHVLEKTLWTGGDLTAARASADRLNADVADLASRLQQLDLEALDLANGALGLLDEIATSKITGEEDRYSHTDLFDVAANLEGSRQAVQCLRPVLARRDPALVAELDRQFAAATAALEDHRRGDGWTSYTDLTRDQLRGLSDAVNALGAVVSRVPAEVAR